MIGESTETPTETHDRHARLWVNWVSALLTVLGAAAVMVLATGAVMSTAACSGAECPELGPNGVGFAVLYYGAPVIAALTILASFWTARRPRGLVVPVAGWLLLTIDLLLLIVIFRR